MFIIIFFSRKPVARSVQPIRATATEIPQTIHSNITSVAYYYIHWLWRIVVFDFVLFGIPQNLQAVGKQGLESTVRYWDTDLFSLKNLSYQEIFIFSFSSYLPLIPLCA